MSTEISTLYPKTTYIQPYYRPSCLPAGKRMKWSVDQLARLSACKVGESSWMLSSYKRYMASAVPVRTVMPPTLYMQISRDVYIKYTKWYYFI